MNFLYWFLKFILLVFFKLFNRLEVFYEERIPREGGVIVTANHASYLDPPLLGAAVRRRATFMARQGLFKIPLLGSFIASYCLPVSRKRPQPSTIKEAVRRLKRGDMIVMFPQGARSIGGDITDIKRGVSVIARLSGAKVVPCLMEGTEKALPIGAWFPMPVKIHVKFGEPINIDGYADEDIADRILEAMNGLKS